MRTLLFSIATVALVHSAAIAQPGYKITTTSGEEIIATEYKAFKSHIEYKNINGYTGSFPRANFSTIENMPSIHSEHETQATKKTPAGTIIKVTETNEQAWRRKKAAMYRAKAAALQAELTRREKDLEQKLQQMRKDAGQ